MTKPRQAVFAALNTAEEPMSIAELITACPRLDRASIYRTLELYETLHIIEIVHVGWKKRYELADPFKPHHHHLQCTQCHELIAIDTPELERLIDQLARAHGYTVTHHHFELQGLCPQCRASSSRHHT